MTRRAYDVPLADGRVLRLGARTLVMGVLNVTPDSFSDGGRWTDPDRAADAALAMEAAGADIVDIGGQTTRPGAEPITARDELARVRPVLARLAGRLRVPFAIDTDKAEVAAAALAAGATIVNDVSGFAHDPAIAGVVARARAAVVLMHMRGWSTDMHQHAAYADVVADVAAELSRSMAAAIAAGVAREAIVLDPGIGFAKTPDQSWRLLARLDAPPLAALDRPWLVGPSRKSFLTAAIDQGPADARDWATAAAVTGAVVAGAHIVRVHRVPEMVQVARVADLFCWHRSPD